MYANDAPLPIKVPAVGLMHRLSGSHTHPFEKNISLLRWAALRCAIR
jgi:hypothetical protein